MEHLLSPVPSVLHGLSPQDIYQESIDKETEVWEDLESHVVSRKTSIWAFQLHCLRASFSAISLLSSNMFSLALVPLPWYQDPVLLGIQLAD